MITTREYGLGTALTTRSPWGQYVAGQVLCSDGKTRKLKRIASTADTFFTVPAAVTVKGKTVSGYVEFETLAGFSTESIDDPWVLKFRASAGSKNHALLPPGTFRKASK